jgi:hypothetical protein
MSLTLEQVFDVRLKIAQTMRRASTLQHLADGELLEVLLELATVIAETEAVHAWEDLYDDQQDQWRENMHLDDGEPLESLTFLDSLLTRDWTDTET